jgi:HSP20 family protein
MNALKFANQMEELEAFQHRLEKCYQASPLSKPGGHDQAAPMSVTEWTPLVDISENSREYRIKVELPEVNREDISVTAEAGALTIMGERKFEKVETDRKYHRVERAYGTFGRSFSLPDDANPAKVRAEFKDGVLSVHLMKDEKVKVQEIKVPIS